MIHPDDWEVLLRAPRGGTVAEWVLWLVIAGPIKMWAAKVAWRRFRNRGARLRPGLLAVGGVLFLLTAYGLWHGVNIRLVQAECWRAGPDAVPARWKGYCERIPPQGVEGLYNSHIFFKE